MTVKFDEDGLRRLEAAAEKLNHLAERLQPPMKKLLFSNPVFEPGQMNVTVRMGDKWAKQGLVPSNTIELVETEGEKPLGFATWAGCMVLSVGQLWEARGVLDLEHDPDCRSYSGLIGELGQVYGVDEIDEGQVVTVVFFVPHAGVAAKAAA